MKAVEFLLADPGVYIPLQEPLISSRCLRVIKSPCSSISLEVPVTMLCLPLKKTNQANQALIFYSLSKYCRI